MDAIALKVRRQVLAGVARAYGLRQTDDFANACPRCHGDGEIYVAGQSINPSSGVLVDDPQQTDVVRCPDCGGTGEATP